MMNMIKRIIPFPFYLLALIFSIGMFYISFFSNFIPSPYSATILVFLCCSFLLCGLLVHFKLAVQEKKASVIRFGSVYCFIIYLITLSIFLFGMPYSFHGASTIPLGNYVIANSSIIPFRTIFACFSNLTSASIIHFLGSLFCFIPLGIFISSIFKHLKDRTILLLLFIVCFVLEVLQLISRVGIFDIDDIILHSLGAILGYWLYRAKLQRPLSKFIS